MHAQVHLPLYDLLDAVMHRVGTEFDWASERESGDCKFIMRSSYGSKSDGAFLCAKHVKVSQ